MPSKIVKHESNFPPMENGHAAPIIDLMKDYRGYTNRQYAGRIAQIKYDAENGRFLHLQSVLSEKQP